MNQTNRTGMQVVSWQFAVGSGGGNASVCGDASSPFPLAAVAAPPEAYVFSSFSLSVRICVICGSARRALRPLWLNSSPDRLTTKPVGVANRMNELGVG